VIGCRENAFAPPHFGHDLGFELRLGLMLVAGRSGYI